MMNVAENTLVNPAIPNPNWSRLLMISVGLIMATSSVVFIEPAPYDLLTLFLFTVLVISGLRFPREMYLPAVILGLFALANTIAAAGSDEPVATFRFLATRIYMLVIWCFFTSLVASGPHQAMRAIWIGYSMAAVLAVCWGAMEYFGFIKMEMWEGGLRAKGPFKDPNVYAPFMLPIALYGLKVFYTDRSSMQKLVHAGLFLFISFGILISFSRGAWLSYLIAFTLFSFCSLVTMSSFKAKLNLILVNMMLVFVTVGVLSYVVTSTSVADRFFERAVITQDYDLREGGRFYTQKESLKTISTNVVGVGPGRSVAELGIQPHNLYLHMFVEGGWLGGLAFLMFVFLSLYRSAPLFRWRSSLRGDFFIVYCSLIGLLAQSLFVDSTHWRHLWLLLGMNWGLIIMYERSKT